ncbi:uncharacterized protein DS421_17g576000 [Arachis hypogaea]|nr:uncharacterized protein DS421_17g576000 [Arachis hypogaea]
MLFVKIEFIYINYFKRYFLYSTNFLIQIYSNNFRSHVFLVFFFSQASSLLSKFLLFPHFFFFSCSFTYGASSSSFSSSRSSSSSFSSFFFAFIFLYVFSPYHYSFVVFAVFFCLFLLLSGEKTVEGEEKEF